MKQVIFFVIALTMLGCSGNSGYTLNFNMDEFADSYILLNTVEDRNLKAIDSVLLNETGEGIISGSVEQPEVMYISQSGTNNIAQIFIGNYNYDISGTSFQEIDIKAKEGPQADYNIYKEKSAGFDSQMQEIADKYREAQSGGKPKETLDQLGVAYDKIQEEKNEYDSSFIVQNPGSFVSLHILRGSYYRLDAEQLEQQLSLIDPSLHQTEYYTMMSDHLERMKSVMIGKKYTDFELPDPDGNPMKLSDVAEKGVLLIDFWASWCGPCRRANPGVVEIYNQFKDKGFDIIGVSLDNDKEKWLKAIEDDKLTWHHISDLQYWQSAGAKLYAVNSIPHTVLLDASGTIIARNPSKEELKSMLKEMLN